MNAQQTPRVYSELTTPVRSHIVMASSPFTGGIYKPTIYNKQRGANEEVICKGFECSEAGDKTIMLHLVGDFNSDGSKRYFAAKALTDFHRQFEFDEVKDTGSTVTDWTKVTLYPR